MLNVVLEEHKADLLKVWYFGAERTKEKMHVEMDAIKIVTSGPDGVIREKRE